MNYGLVLEILNGIKAGNIHDRSKGICANLIWHMDFDMGLEFVQESFTSIFGKVICSPVEGDIISYVKNKRKWDKETDLGLRRYALLDKMIAYAELKLAEEVA
jgi:hypothetical protein